MLIKLAVISSKIQTKLEELFGDNFIVTDNEATFTRGYLRIGIYLKTNQCIYNLVLIHNT
jgi:hypothetical protein